MHRLAMKRSLSRGTVVWSALVALSALAAGCTQMTTPPEQDAGPTRDGGSDGGAAEDGGVLPPPVIETCVEAGSTLGEACSGGCDDGCYCNGVERCEEGVCVAGEAPCVDEVECTADVCLEEANRCFHEPQHEMCTNGDACDGIELCNPTLGCGPGAPPYCNDESSCTVDSCDPEMGCVFSARDLDGDGYTDGGCGGEDCDDDPRFGTDIHPGATEICDNRRDDDCDGMRDYNDSDCAPSNDTCETAVLLPGAGTYSGSTRSPLVGNYTLGCRTGAGPDAVFRFTLAEMSDVRVTVAGGGTNVAVALRPWAQCASGPDDKCNNGAPPTFLRRSLPAGEYAIIVQASTGGGAFDLNLRIDPPTEIPPIDECGPGTEDLCGGAPCTTLAGAVFTGMFADTEDDYSLSCGTSSRRDAVYRFTLDAPKDVTVRATSGPSTWTTTYLALTTDCASQAAERRCIASSSAEIRQRELGPGTYYLIVESGDVSSATYSMTVTITDPVPRVPGDACSTAVDISEATLGGGGMGSASVGSLELDSGTSCGGTSTSYRDATFRFTLPTTRDVTLTTSVGTSFHYVSLQTACGDSSSDLRCWSGSGTLGQSWRSLPAGEYFVTMAMSVTSGTATASLMTREPTPIPPNDQCPGAITLASGASESGSTIGFEDNATGGTCAGGSKPDAFYRFTLASRMRAIVSVSDADDPATTTFWVTLRADPCGTGTQHGCVSGTTATVNAVLEPGTYFLQVESNSTDTSDFNISAAFFPP